MVTSAFSPETTLEAGTRATGEGGSKGRVTCIQLTSRPLVPPPSRDNMDTPASNTEAPPTPSPAPPQIPSASTTATTPAPAPAVASAPIKKQYNKRVNKVYSHTCKHLIKATDEHAQKKVEGLLAYTTAFVPGTYNVKIPAGDYLQKERNADVARQMSLDRAKREEEELSSKISAAGDGEREVRDIILSMANVTRALIESTEPSFQDPRHSSRITQSSFRTCI